MKSRESRAPAWRPSPGLSPKVVPLPSQGWAMSDRNDALWSNLAVVFMAVTPLSSCEADDSAACSKRLGQRGIRGSYGKCGKCGDIMRRLIPISRSSSLCRSTLRRRESPTRRFALRTAARPVGRVRQSPVSADGEKRTNRERFDLTMNHPWAMTGARTGFGPRAVFDIVQRKKPPRRPGGAGESRNILPGRPGWIDPLG